MLLALVFWSFNGLGAQDPEDSLTPMEDRPPAPDFELRDLHGEVHRLADYREKVLIVNFWATWCPPCRKEMPSMQRAWELVRGEGIAMLAINVGEDEETISSSFIAEGLSPSPKASR